MHLLRNVLLGSLALALAPVSSASATATGFAPLAPDGTIEPRAHGVWQSRGYGWMVRLNEDGLELYDHSPAGIMRAGAGLEAMLVAESLFRVDGDTLVVSTAPENATAYTFDRREALPVGFDRPPYDDALSVFDYFWEGMNAHYAFFDLYGVNWDERRDEHRPRVDADTTDRELFEVLCDMLRGLTDDHLGLSATIAGREHEFTQGEPRVLWPALAATFAEQDEVDDIEQHRVAWIRRYKQAVATEVLGGDYRLEADGRVVWGRIGRIGYLNVLAMGGFSDRDELDAEIAGVHAAMSKIVSGLADCDGMIVDVTLNSGGYDEVQLAIASHFTDRRVLAFTKFAADTSDAPRQAFHVVPAERDLFLKPVSLVTSDYTVSAGEDFTLAMRSIPSVTHRGMTTRGAFSDMLEKRLPNGWSISLSNEVYLDTAGRHWEAMGIPPEDPILVFDPADLERSHARAILGIAEKMSAGGD